MYEYNSNHPGHLWGESGTAGAGVGAGAAAAGTAAAVGAGARAFVPPASSPYTNDYAPGSPQPVTNDGYYYATNGNTYSQQGEEDLYNHDAQYTANNAYYNGGYQDGNQMGSEPYNDYGYYNHELYTTDGAVGLADAGAAFGTANHDTTGIQHSEGTGPHSVYSKPDARE
jgi:hypothetical protein